MHTSWWPPQSKCIQEDIWFPPEVSSHLRIAHHLYILALPPPTSPTTSIVEACLLNNLNTKKPPVARVAADEENNTNRHSKQLPRRHLLLPNPLVILRLLLRQHRSHFRLGPHIMRLAISTGTITLDLSRDIRGQLWCPKLDL